MYKINEKITLDLLKKDKVDPVFAAATWKRNKAAIDMFKPWIKGTVFEIGCRHGVLLEQINNMGYSTFGIDISKEAIELSRQKGLNCEVQSAESFIENLELFNKFDTIFCLHTLEHCIDVPKVIDGIYNCLKVDGHALIEIPLQPKEPTPTKWGHYYCFTTENELINMFKMFTHLKTFRQDRHTWRRFVFKKEML